MRQQKAKQILVVALVATVLCTGELASAAPSQRTETAAPRGSATFVQRLTVSLRRAVPAMPMIQRLAGVDAIAATDFTTPQQVFIAAVPLSPFQFRLPPPAV